MVKYYKVITENFLWEVGAIIKMDENAHQYYCIDEMFKIIPESEGEYIGKDHIEGNPTYFERVYKVNLATQVVYETKEKAKELIAGLYKSK